MIEFSLKKIRNGKRSRWNKKYPRKAILRRGGEKAANWFRDNWIDDNFTYFDGNVVRFLKANIGRPINNVFSEFLKRCDNNLKGNYNLRKWFYSYIKEKKDIDYKGGFYLTNGILNYKKRTSKPIKNIKYFSYDEYNTDNMPPLKAICKACDVTHSRQLIGNFYIKGRLQKVYLIKREDYVNDWFYLLKFDYCFVSPLGRGVNICKYPNEHCVFADTYFFEENKFKPEYLFITKSK